jgi:hypothetical protein
VQHALCAWLRYERLLRNDGESHERLRGKLSEHPARACARRA